jgi:hypothetical protein
MKRFFLVLFCVCALPVLASHIVGGEFEIKHINGNLYRITLILYFDEANGNPGAQDPQVVARIFRKSDNVAVKTVTLPFYKEENVEYTAPECTVGDLETRKLFYSAEFILTNEMFSDPQGYYIAWERCCRNYAIDNIYSENPQNPATYTGKFAGQTFYLEFPPIVKDGLPFINSTPRLFPPLSDYGCPNRKYYVDFAGVDDDGDSLVYSLTAPLNTWAADALPVGGPGPGQYPLVPTNYPTVQWRDGYSMDNITKGNPDLAISEDGFLTITPRQPVPNGSGDIGDLLVFAVKCEEFRDGVKIGEVRRDFQMLVLNSCPVADPPQILGKKLTDTNFTFDENMVVSFSNTVTDDERCVQVQVSDLDSKKTSTIVKDNKKEYVKIRAVALNFKNKNISDEVLPAVTTAILQDGSTADFRICFDKCPYIIGSPYQIGIVAYDDACALPLSDTLKILVNVEPPPNQPPVFTTSDVNSVVNEGTPKSYAIQGFDPDGNPLLVSITNDGFALAAVGMKLTNTPTGSNEYKATLDWDTKCNIYDFTKKTSFELKIGIEDLDECNIPLKDVMTLKLQVLLPGNADPIISTDLTADEVANGVERKIFQNLDFNVFGNDPVDNDHLVLTATGLGYNMTTYSMDAPQHAGTAHVQTHFNWDIVCNQMNLEAKDVFDVRFIVVDNANKCRFYKADTLDVKIKVLPPDNEKPLLTLVNNNPELVLSNNEQSIILGQQVTLGIISNDPYVAPKNDHVKIELINADGNVPPTGYEFAPAEGDGSASTTFVWNPDCSIFEKNGEYQNNYTFTFRTYDDRCFNIKGDTVEYKLTIKDVDGSDGEFIPPNIVTANGDGCNDFFAMEELEDLGSCNGNPEVIQPHLPKDNCIGRFVEVLIYNRWGGEVYRSERRNFRWYPHDEAAGVYFYTLKFSHKEYKGTIHLRN